MSQPALRAANDAFYAAFESLDIERMTQLWSRATNVTCVHPGWDLLIGHEAVMQSWRGIFEGTREIRFRVEVGSITVGSDMGWVLCREILLTTVQGSEVENAMTAINTFVLEDGNWRVAHHHASPVLAGRAQRQRPPEPLLH
jgi:ketosteroid isomerase-like protein